MNLKYAYRWAQTLASTKSINNKENVNEYSYFWFYKVEIDYNLYKEILNENFKINKEISKNFKNKYDFIFSMKLIGSWEPELFDPNRYVSDLKIIGKKKHFINEIYKWERRPFEMVKKEMKSKEYWDKILKHSKDAIKDNL